SLLEDNNFSVDNYQTFDFEDAQLYGYEIGFLDYEVHRNLSDNNTISFVLAASLMADENELMVKLINDIVNGTFSSTQLEAEENLKRLSEQIIRHEKEFDSALQILEYEVEQDTKELYNNLVKLQDFMQVAIL